MRAYWLRRLALIPPTLLAIITINFAVVQFAPGGPVEQIVADLRGRGGDPTARLSGGGAEVASQTGGDTSRASRGIDPKLLADLRKTFGFDRPFLARYAAMVGRFATFDFGDSFFQNGTVWQLVVARVPISVSIGLWSTLLIYAISIPLGIAKAVRAGSRFDLVTSTLVLTGYAIPGFLFAILLIVLFAGGSFVQWFPIRGLATSGSAAWPWIDRARDYAWHMVLPTLALVIGGFASLTILTKNCFLEEIRKAYVTTARAKGASEARVLYRHVFRNAMLLIVAGFPAAFISILFSSALLIEIVFSLDGLGLLGFEAAVRRDYPVMFGTLYMFTLVGLLLQVVGDAMYAAIDPRIDFARAR